MKVFIIEDEKIAQSVLIRALERIAEDITVMGTAESVTAACDWLQDTENKPDIIFMDVELQDGSCFEIFRRVDISAKVIMTTAYDKYAVKAFETGSVDYLLKPYDDESLIRALGRCRERDRKDAYDVDTLVATLHKIMEKKSEGGSYYKRRIIVKIGSKIIPVDVNDISYFYVEGKSRFVVTKEGARYIIDQQIDDLMEELDPDIFFRISRSYVISSGAIRSIDRLMGGRLRVVVDSKNDENMIVSRSRVADFLAWLA